MSPILEEKNRTEEKEKRRRGEEEIRVGEDSSFILHPSFFAAPQPVAIRAYRTQDYPMVLALWQEANLRPFMEPELERLLGSGGGALVAVIQGNSLAQEQAEDAGATPTQEDTIPSDEQIVGVILWSHNGSVGILWRLAVAANQRGQGIATKLLDRAEHDIRNAGLSGVTLLTRVTNTVAKSMYTKRGYKHNDHLEFWGKKLPELVPTPEVNEEATSC